ncbi:unnamed protein product [Dovyalis caffra]|uniref:DNA sliding clamp PCNA n=1 Tax=Dovyalis caffra TaxID=77055 RepID=A0AAV1QYX7_9ROSI|nr:unnamed protein product [Dovyalis caffra]
MNSSHVALVSHLLLRSHGFDNYRCNRNFSVGMNIDQDRIADLEMNLIDIDSEHLGIPEAEYQAIVRMPSFDFAKFVSTSAEWMILKLKSTNFESLTDGLSCSWDICGKGRKNTSVDKVTFLFSVFMPEAAVVIEMEEPVSLTFALRYLNSFTKATPLAEQVIITMSPDFPVFFSEVPFLLKNNCPFKGYVLRLLDGSHRLIHLLRRFGPFKLMELNMKGYGTQKSVSFEDE